MSKRIQLPGRHPAEPCSTEDTILERLLIVPRTKRTSTLDPLLCFWCASLLCAREKQGWYLIASTCSVQGMACRPNTHRPSFHVNMVGLEKTQRSNSSRFPWDLDAEMMDEDEEEFEVWLQQALASGLFCESSKRRKSWSPFKLPQRVKRQSRRTSC